MLKKAISGLLGVLVLIFVGGFILPSKIHVERHIYINATPAEIFPIVSDLADWQTWSPWAKLDPDMNFSVTGSGVGQMMQWQSQDPRVGIGTQTVMEIVSPGYVKTHLDFGDQGVADAAFELIPKGEGTLVSWSLNTDMRTGVPLLKQPMSTYFGFLMDQSVGKEYEIGLANIQAVVEE